MQLKKFRNIGTIRRFVAKFIFLIFYNFLIEIFRQNVAVLIASTILIRIKITRSVIPRNIFIGVLYPISKAPKRSVGETLRGFEEEKKPIEIIAWFILSELKEKSVFLKYIKKKLICHSSAQREETWLSIHDWRI